MPVKIGGLLSVKLLLPKMPCCNDSDKSNFVVFNLFDSALSCQSPEVEWLFIRCVLGCHGWPYRPMHFELQQQSESTIILPDIGEKLTWSNLGGRSKK